MTSTPNAYCAALGITAPRLEDAKSSPDANYYSLLIIALLERGVPMTLGMCPLALPQQASRRRRLTRSLHSSDANRRVHPSIVTAITTPLILTTTRSASGCFGSASDPRAARR